MIDIGTNSFFIKVPNLPPQEFEHYSSELFDNWERSLEKTLMLSDYSISLEIEEGSIKGKGKIAAALTVVYIGIGTYGDFISGLETIHNQVSYATNTLFNSATEPFGGSSASSKTSNRGGAISRLRKLFYKVQIGELAVDEAMEHAKILFGEEGKETPEFMRELHQQLKNAPKHPQQQSFDGEEWEQLPIDDSSPIPQKPRRKSPFVPQHYRVLVWRESKQKKKQIKVTKL